jgi:hypothetical protein
MVGSSVVDMVVGVLFVFLVFSLVVSGVNEVITRLFAWRSRHLWRSLWQLLDGEEKKGTADPRPGRVDPTSARWTERLYAHTLIQQLEGWTPTGRSRLSNIPASDFSRAVLDLVSEDEVTTDGVRAALIGPRDAPETETPRASTPLEESLRALARSAGARVEDLLGDIEDWFDARMEALSKSYKSHVKWVLVAVGIVVAVVFNVDAVGASQRLYRDEALRTAVADQATAVVAACEGQADVSACTRERVAKVDAAIRLPVGWPDPDGITWVQGLGWLIAGIALGQGAPFWFDVLRRAGKLRS